MEKYRKFVNIISFFCLWIDSFFLEKTQVIIGFALIFTVGIFHGSNDLMLLKKLNKEKDAHSNIKILMKYIAVVLLGIVSFYNIPFIALVLFIFISAYHFGEQQWQHIEEYPSKIIKHIFQFVYGTCILFLLFYFNKEEVQQIIFEISSVNIPDFYFQLLTSITIFITFILFVYLYVKVISLRNILLQDFFYLFIFSIIFVSSSLIWGFAIYFVLWHSFPSVISQIEFLYGDVTKSTSIKYFKSGLIIWLISLFGVVILYLLLKDEIIFNAVFFSFLAAITFPHAFVISKMFRE